MKREGQNARNLARRGGGKHGILDLPDMYKLPLDDVRGDRVVVGIDDDDGDDLSPKFGPAKERLPALENAVENSAYKNAIFEPLKV